MEDFITMLHRYLFVGAATLFIFQSIILFINSKEYIARRTMAVIELIWGIEYAITLFTVIGKIPVEGYSILRAEVLIIGSFFITITQFFPIQVLLPGWLNCRRALILMLPNIVLGAMYYGGVALMQETTENIVSYAMLWKSIGHFNVWFRLIILLSNVFYLGWILKWLYGYEKRYIKWKNDNFADQEYVDIAWMRSYDYIIIGITIFYIGILFVGGEIMAVYHCMFATVSFSYLFYKILFYKNPYPEDFFNAEQQSAAASYSHEKDGLTPEMDAAMEDEDTFEDKIPGYTKLLKDWMEKEQPYLYHDFKLTDVTHLLPLNRSYLSRVFNDGFGRNFSEVVRYYRVNHAKKLMASDPSMSINRLAELCGFNSDTSFIRAFKQVENITPRLYKELRQKG